MKTMMTKTILTMPMKQTMMIIIIMTILKHHDDHDDKDDTDHADEADDNGGGEEAGLLGLLDAWQGEVPLHLKCLSQCNGLLYRNEHFDIDYDDDGEKENKNDDVRSNPQRW